MSDASEVGWDAGIRTPITCSRGRCPTVERRPSTSRTRRAGETRLYPPALARGQACALDAGAGSSSAQIAGTAAIRRLVTTAGRATVVAVRRAAALLFLLAAMACHAALPARFP